MLKYLICVQTMNLHDFVLIVPIPIIDVTSSHTPPVYAGSSLTLACTVTLDPNANNDETITIEWMGPRNITGERYRIIHNNLTINPLVSQDTAMTFTCTVSVTGGMYVHQVTTNSSYHIPTIRKTLHDMSM